MLSFTKKLNVDITSWDPEPLEPHKNKSVTKFPNTFDYEKTRNASRTNYNLVSTQLINAQNIIKSSNSYKFTEHHAALVNPH
jgi:hypothetical protein